MARGRFLNPATPRYPAAVAAVLPATVDPQNPSDAAVSYPTDILQAEIAAKGAYNGLFLGLGAVALLVGGVGIANVMVISVLERRSEIGLRRALGATRRHIAEQFLTEALLLSLLGGLAGTVIGTAATWAYALTQHGSLLIPPQALYGGITAALAIGAIAEPLPRQLRRPPVPNRSTPHRMTTGRTDQESRTCWRLWRLGHTRQALDNARFPRSGWRSPLRDVDKARLYQRPSAEHSLYLGCVPEYRLGLVLAFVAAQNV
ncbi:MAG TPA: ABC transporter permease [Streptosporangiaceae bacterium]